MGSLGNNPSPSSWPPYQSYRDCSQGICSIYCPQWCYIIFPPPPPFHDSYSDSGTNFSPLIIAIIGILASAFLLFSYYIVVAKYWRRRLNNNQLTSTTPELDSNQAQTNNHDQRPQLATSGLDEIVIKSIAICKYRKGDGFVDGTDCAVCLSEFQENENLRLLPKCSHAFHPPCIDTWLRSHSNCPLCRSNVSPIPIATAPPESHPPPTLLDISSLEFQRGSDLVLVVEEREGVDSEQREGCNNDEVLLPKYPFSQSQFRCPSDNQEFRRSSSMGSFANSHNNLLIADILSTDEDLQAEIGIGSSNSRESENMANMRRSISTGRFFTTSDHRRNSALILPN